VVAGDFLRKGRWWYYSRSFHLERLEVIKWWPYFDGFYSVHVPVSEEEVFGHAV
jgi:hypothetical protein